jgi:hypothetical protein
MFGFEMHGHSFIVEAIRYPLLDVDQETAFEQITALTFFHENCG